MLLARRRRAAFRPPSWPIPCTCPGALDLLLGLFGGFSLYIGVNELHQWRAHVQTLTAPSIQKA